MTSKELKDFYLYLKVTTRGFTQADFAKKTWKKLIKDGLGLDISLYSFKGLGGEDKRKAGIDLGTISAGFGHSSLNMTKVYLHGEQDRINHELRTKTPEL